MIPSAAGIRVGQGLTVVEVKDQPSKTYAIDFTRGRVSGHVDGLDAIRQAIEKILRTERFHYLIYSNDYGIELDGAFGQSFPVAESEIKRALKEALLQDGRIQDVRGITVERAGRRGIKVAFTAVTALGEVYTEKEIVNE